jgi:hypothetical protein
MIKKISLIAGIIIITILSLIVLAQETPDYTNTEVVNNLNSEDLAAAIISGDVNADIVTEANLVQAIEENPKVAIKLNDINLARAINSDLDLMDIEGEVFREVDSRAKNPEFLNNKENAEIKIEWFNQRQISDEGTKIASYDGKTLTLKGTKGEQGATIVDINSKGLRNAEVTEKGELILSQGSKHTKGAKVAFLETTNSFGEQITKTKVEGGRNHISKDNYNHIFMHVSEGFVVVGENGYSTDVNGLEVINKKGITTLSGRALEIADFENVKNSLDLKKNAIGEFDGKITIHQDGHKTIGKGTQYDAIYIQPKKNTESSVDEDIVSFKVKEDTEFYRTELNQENPCLEETDSCILFQHSPDQPAEAYVKAKDNRIKITSQYEQLGKLHVAEIDDGSEVFYDWTYVTETGRKYPMMRFSHNNYEVLGEINKDSPEIFFDADQDNLVTDMEGQSSIMTSDGDIIDNVLLEGCKGIKGGCGGEEMLAYLQSQDYFVGEDGKVYRFYGADGFISADGSTYRINDAGGIYRGESLPEDSDADTVFRTKDGKLIPHLFSIHPEWDVDGGGRTRPLSDVDYDELFKKEEYYLGDDGKVYYYKGDTTDIGGHVRSFQAVDGSTYYVGDDGGFHRGNRISLEESTEPKGDTSIRTPDGKKVADSVFDAVMENWEVKKGCCNREQMDKGLSENYPTIIADDGKVYHYAGDLFKDGTRSYVSNDGSRIMIGDMGEFSYGEKNEEVADAARGTSIRTPDGKVASLRYDITGWGEAVSQEERDELFREQFPEVIGDDGRFYYYSTSEDGRIQYTSRDGHTITTNDAAVFDYGDREIPQVVIKDGEVKTCYQNNCNLDGTVENLASQ